RRPPGGAVRHPGGDADHPARFPRPLVVRAGRIAGGPADRRAARPHRRARSVPRPVSETGGGTADSGPDRAVLKVVAMVAFLVVALIFYFLWLGRIAVALLTSGDIAAIGLGIGVLILPLLGVWMVVSTIRSALDHQRLARRIHDEGLELEIDDLPRRPSGRIERAAADELFLTVKQEWEADPD